jgi:hypothetical protein
MGLFDEKMLIKVFVAQLVLLHLEPTGSSTWCTFGNFGDYRNVELNFRLTLPMKMIDSSTIRQ